MRAYQIIEAGLNSAKTKSGQYQIEDISLYEDYSEPGYSSPKSGIALGVWNDISDYDSNTGVYTILDSSPTRVGKLLERLGYELEWTDEWTSCGSCGKLVRTQPSSYHWVQSFSIIDGDVVCLECLNPEEHLESLEGDSKNANTIETINPSDHGYTKYNGIFESGWYEGQNDDPRAIAKAMKNKLGVERFLFNIEGVGQFDLHFSVYVHNSEIHKTEGQTIKAS